MDCDKNELALCKFLLQKYADIINEREKRTIGEIKALVDGNDLSVQSLADDFKEKDYSFENNYSASLKKAFEYVSEEINFVEADLGMNYWLTPREVLEMKLADDEDLAVFMCNLARALGDKSAEVIIAELDNLKTHAFVMTQIGEDSLILDPAQKHKFELYLGKKVDVLGKYDFQKQKIRKFLYRFNAEKYEQFLE
ncbi:MAG: hypothetical protein AABW59_02705 [archaeon]